MHPSPVAPEPAVAADYIFLAALEFGKKNQLNVIYKHNHLRQEMTSPRVPSRILPVKKDVGYKGSRKIKFAILGVAAPGRHGLKTQDYLDISSFSNPAGRDASAVKMGRYV